MPKRLTDSAITRALRDAGSAGKRIEIADAGQPGLRVRVTPAGRSTWVLACRDRLGRMRRFVVGAYPDLGISAARDAARAMHHKVRQEGADPVRERREARAKAALAVVNTLADAIDLYERQGGTKKRRAADLRSWPEYRASIGRVFGRFLKLPLADLRSADLQLTADSYAAQAQASLAVRCIRPILRWASSPSRGYVSPELAAISPPAVVERRSRVLTHDELASLLPVLAASERPYAAVMRLILLTGLRRSEADGLRWKDIDLTARTITIARERSKNRQQHLVPLSRQATELLQARLPTDDAGQQLAPDPESLVFATRSGKPLPNWDRATKQITVEAGHVAKDGWIPWHRHDLRRSAATELGRLGVPPHVIEAALGHVAIHSELASIYNQHRYGREVSDALQRLADHLDGIARGSAEIIPLRKQQASAAV